MDVNSGNLAEDASPRTAPPTFRLYYDKYFTSPRKGNFLISAIVPLVADIAAIMGDMRWVRSQLPRDSFKLRFDVDAQRS
eukprot:scaffold10185_cov283-Chaetoceros_neogracile.AAC.4